MPSFNSSGRSSNCDGDDMQSDISLEEDVNDLNQKVSLMVEVLEPDSHSPNSARFDFH